MKTQSVYLIVIGLVLALALGACGGKDPVTPGGSSTSTTVTLDFEDLTVGNSQIVGTNFTTNTVVVNVERFQWSSGTWSSAGNITFQDNQYAGGTGTDVWTNNANLNITLPSGVTRIVFKCIDFGGNCNMTINSTFENEENLINLNGQTIDGVDVTVAGATGSPQTITLEGAITAFKVGGQEFAIDDFAYTYTP